MGFCVEFGPRITEGCEHAMVAGATSCSCPDCGAVCQGQFDGCSSVWTGVVAQAEAPAAPVASTAEPSIAAPVQDDVLHLLHTSLVELTDEFRTVVAAVTEQGAETRALLEAQTTATQLLVEAIRALPRQLEAGDEPAAEPGEEAGEDSGPQVREPIELLRPEVVRFEQDAQETGDDAWAARHGRSYRA